MDSQAKQQYEIQHFSFSVEQLKLECRLVIKKRLEEVIQGLMDTLIVKETIVVDENIMKSAKTKAIQDVKHTIKNKISSIDKLIDKYFLIPDDILLPDDYTQKEYTLGEENKLKDRLSEIKKEFLENKFMLLQLSEELKINESINEIINQEEYVFNYLKSCIEFSDTLDNYNNEEKSINDLNRLLKLQ